MDLLIPINERDRRLNVGDSKVSYLLKDETNPPISNDIYIGQIPGEIEVNVLHSFFSQFGEIERIFEGRKASSSGMKWAFISYTHPEDAYKYIPFDNCGNLQCITKSGKIGTWRLPPVRFHNCLV